MPPRPRILVDPGDILLAIANASEIQIEAAQRELDATEPVWAFRATTALREAKMEWVKYDLTTFSGRRDLTESESTVWRRRVRELERDGFVEIVGLHATDIRLTDAGKQRVSDLHAERSQVKA